MAGEVSKVIFSRFFLWMIILGAGIYYLLPNLVISEAKNRFALSRVGLGIDLQGGTYITLGVDVDSVLETRLSREKNSIESTFQKKDLSVMPSTSEVKDGKLIFSFPHVEGAKVALNLVKDEYPLDAKRVEDRVIVTLPAKEATRISTGTVEQAINVIGNRIDGFGVAGSIVQQHGSRKIVVQLPGVDDPERVKDLITKQAVLEFKIIRDSSTSKDVLLDKFDGELPPDLMIISGERGRKDVGNDETRGKFYLVSKYPDMIGDHLHNSFVDRGQIGQRVISLEFTSAGGSQFAELTAENVGKQLGVVLDNVVLTAPSINEAIPSGRASIGRGNQSIPLKEAQDLSLVLRSGSFNAPVTYEEERRIGPSLGQDSIRKGLLSCLVGLALVFLFMLIFYRIPGIFAIFALIYNLFMILLFLSFFEATLTLPGIAGMVLTIGMAIDASILIFEHIKEELAKGTPYRKAVNLGFKDAMVVILDSNITTFLTGLVLFYFGGPSIQGFAVTLMLGIVATILSGVFFLKSIFEFVLNTTRVSRIPF